MPFDLLSLIGSSLGFNWLENDHSDKFPDTSRTISHEKTSSDFEKFNRRSSIKTFTLHNTLFFIRTSTI